MNMKQGETVVMISLFAALLPCGSLHSQKPKAQKEKILSCCQKKLPSRFTAKALGYSTASHVLQSNAAHEGMVWINAGEYLLGSSNQEGRPDEYPRHKVKVVGFEWTQPK